MTTEYCGHCGTVLDENGNCPADPQVNVADVPFYEMDEVEVMADNPTDDLLEAL